MKLSCIIITKNEEANIKDCLEDLAFCEERIVVDDDSEDKTREIAQSLGAIVLRHSLGGDFAAQRNFGLNKARGEWVIFVDADERVEKKLRDEIKNKTSNNNNPTGYYIVRRDVLWERVLRYGEVGSARSIRLAKKNAGRWEGKVHERWVIEGSIGLFNNYLFHYPHQTIREFLIDINHYTSIRARELFDQKVKTSFWQIIAYPFAKFIQSYFLQRGMLDGIAGLLVAIMMSFHSFLVRGKLWLLWQTKNKR